MLRFQIHLVSCAKKDNHKKEAQRRPAPLRDRNIRSKHAISSRANAGFNASRYESVPLVLSKYIYIIYTPNLGLRIAVPGREREQKGSMGEQRGSKREQEGARGSKREQEGARGRLF